MSLAEQVKVILEETAKIEETKEALKEAINKKGGEITDSTPFSSYPTAIEEIRSSGKPDKTLPVYENGWYNVLEYSNVEVLFSEFTYFEDIFKKSHCADYAFQNFKTLTAVPSDLNLTDVTSANSTFTGCENLTNVVLERSAQVLRSPSIFAGCHNLETVFFETFSNTNISFAFLDCPKLKKVELTHLNSSEDHGVFAVCPSLETIVINNISNDFIGWNEDNFLNCDSLKEIYVPDYAVDKMKTAEGWIKYASIIKPLSSLRVD